MHEALVERGIDVRLAVEAQAVRRDGAIVTVDLSDGEHVDGNEIVVAVGRRPRTDDLGLETVGLEPGKPVAVDDTLGAPDLPWLYAIGDVNDRSLLTHVGKYQARVACQVIDGGQPRATRDGGAAPRVVFTDPQVAAVGLTPQAAKDQGPNARAYDVPSSATAGASFYGRDTPGTSRLVVDEDRGVIVGATSTGTDVADWLHAATIASSARSPSSACGKPSPRFPPAAKRGSTCSRNATPSARERGGQTHGVAAG